MKKRINITIEYDIYEEAKKNIKNISKYLETCLIRFNTKCKEVNQEKPKDKNNIISVKDRVNLNNFSRISSNDNDFTKEDYDELMKELDELDKDKINVL